MTKELKKLDGQRGLFISTFVRNGLKNGFKGAPLPTILLKDVRSVSENKLMCDHLQINKTKALAALDLFAGLQLQFAARVKQYSKGYQGKKDIKKGIKQDFKLSHPTQIEVLGSKDENTEPKLIIRKAKRSDF